ncbi:MAG TPA: hypothetical protein VLZ74_16420 [Methylocella sp.]|nr:hypothetical protein [Methylocella sp.]
MKRVPMVIALGLGLLLAGCPRTPVTLKTVTLTPSQMNGSYRYWYSQNAWCSVPLPGQGLFLNGLGPEPLGPGEVYSGFEDIYNKGAEPFPCEEQQQTLYRGQVAFDLSQFDNITSATLNFNVERSIAENGGVTDQVPPSSDATTLGVSTGTRDDGNGPYFWDFDNAASLPSCGPLITPNCSVGVSSQARDWATHAHPNFGFILAGPILDFPSNLPKDNNGNVSWYDDFQLQVTYNPAQNPRAPQ